MEKSIPKRLYLLLLQLLFLLAVAFNFSFVFSMLLHMETAIVKRWGGGVEFKVDLHPNTIKKAKSKMATFSFLYPCHFNQINLPKIT